MVKKNILKELLDGSGEIQRASADEIILYIYLAMRQPADGVVYLAPSLATKALGFSQTYIYKLLKRLERDKKVKVTGYKDRCVYKVKLLGNAFLQATDISEYMKFDAEFFHTQEFQKMNRTMITILIRAWIYHEVCRSKNIVESVTMSKIMEWTGSKLPACKRAIKKLQELGERHPTKFFSIDYKDKSLTDKTSVVFASSIMSHGKSHVTLRHEHIISILEYQNKYSVSGELANDLAAILNNYSETVAVLSESARIGDKLPLPAIEKILDETLGAAKKKKKAIRISNIYGKLHEAIGGALYQLFGKERPLEPIDSKHTLWASWVETVEAYITNRDFRRTLLRC